MLVDSHCHLHLIDYDKLNINLETVIQNCKQNKVEKLLNVATTLDQVTPMQKIHDQFDMVYSSIGVHPCETIASKVNTDEIINLAQQDNKIIAIGETGLDYFHPGYDDKLQTKSFVSHIQAAKQVAKPIIVHTRNARKDTVDILKAEADDVFGVIHCFTENKTMAKSCLDLGFYISISGIVTFNKAHELQDVVKYLPLDRILIETDSPYLAPVPNRGKTNQPAYVPYVAKFIAKLKNHSFEAVAKATTDNFYQLFNSCPDSR